MISHNTINVVQKKLRKFDEKENYVFPAGLMAKIKRKSHLNHIWYDFIDIGNETIAGMILRNRMRPGVRRRGELDVLEMKNCIWQYSKEGEWNWNDRLF